MTIPELLGEEVSQLSLDHAQHSLRIKAIDELYDAWVARLDACLKKLEAHNVR